MKVKLIAASLVAAVSMLVPVGIASAGAYDGADSARTAQPNAYWGS